jgi:hypothetical protein
MSEQNMYNPEWQAIFTPHKKAIDVAAECACCQPATVTACVAG